MTLTERDRVNIQAVRVMLELGRISRRPGLCKAAWLDIAIHLARLREVEGRTGAEWESIIKGECGLAKSRAYEIMSLVRKKSAKESTVAAEKMQQYQSKGETR
jgi:hypothetical protein